MFCDVSVDVLFLILAYLDVGDLLRCKQVCTLLKQIIDTDLRLQYKIELAINGMVEGPAAARVCISTRLERLRAYSERLCQAEFFCESESLSHSGKEGCGAISSWTPTSFGYSIVYRLQTSRFVPHSEQEGHTLAVYHPPSGIDNTPARCWSRTLPAAKQVVAVDVSQDLVVIHEAGDRDHGRPTRLHFLSLETWEGHPNASYPVIEGQLAENAVPVIDTSSLRHHASCFTDAKVYGRHVAWNALCYDEHDSNAVEIWDWQKGHIKWHGHFPRYTTYTFLDSEHIVVSSEGDLLIYKFSDSVKDIICTNAIGRSVEPNLVLELPSCAQWCTIQDAAAPTSDAAPAFAFFWPDAALRIIQVVFLIAALETPTGGSIFYDYQCILLIPYRTFRERIDQNRSRAESTPTSSSPGGSGSGSVSVDWASWGPQGGLLLKNSGIQTPLWTTVRPIWYHPFGSRISILVNDEDQQRVRVLTFDTNPWAFGHKQHSGCRQSKYPGDKDKTAIEDFSDVQDKDGSCLLQTSLPRVVYEKSVPSELQCPFVVSQHQHGFTVVRGGENVYHITGLQAFYV